MELKPFSKSEMHNNLDGHTVRDFSSPEHGIRNQRISVEGRSPEQEYHPSRLGILMVQVMNRHGQLLLNTPDGEKASTIYHGDIIYIDPQEEYAFEGTMSVMCTELPVAPKSIPEYADEN